jgi:hypothetical protein
VLDVRERVVEVVQQSAPLRVLLRATEPLRVILKRSPTNTKHVSARTLQTTFEIQLLEPSHRGNDRLRPIERCLELCLLTRLHIENRKFSYHSMIVTQHERPRTGGGCFAGACGLHLGRGYRTYPDIRPLIDAAAPFGDECLTREVGRNSVKDVIQNIARHFALGGAVAALGAAWCLANDHYWQTRSATISIGYGYPSSTASFFLSVVGDLMFTAIPFYVLGIAAFLGRPRLIGTALAFVGLAALTSLAYQANATSTSSTAPLVFLASVFYGTVLVAGVVLLQVLIDALRSRRTRAFVDGLSEADQADWAKFVAGETDR